MNDQNLTFISNELNNIRIDFLEYECDSIGFTILIKGYKTDSVNRCCGNG